MKHKVMTEEEIAEAALLPEGVYDFTIVTAEEATSKAGKDMFKLKLNVFQPDGDARVIFDWVLPDFPKKYKHLHDACGLLDLYQSGETTTDDLVDKSGKLMLGIGKPYTDNSGIERINNSVVDYVKSENMVPNEPRKSPVAAIEDDEIPF